MTIVSIVVVARRLLHFIPFKVTLLHFLRIFLIYNTTERNANRIGDIGLRRDAQSPVVIDLKTLSD